MKEIQMCTYMYVQAVPIHVKQCDLKLGEKERNLASFLKVES